MLYSPERTTSDQHNAAGLAGIEFIEFATFDDAETRALTNIFRALGFIKFAQHRSRQVELYRQGDINLIINHEPGCFGRSFATVHGLSVCALGLRFANAEKAFTTMLRHGARAYEAQGRPGELNVPAVRGVSGSLIYLIDQFGAYGSIYDVDFDNLSPSDPWSGAGLVRIDHLSQTVFPGRTRQWVGYYYRLFGLEALEHNCIKDPRGYTFSTVVASPEAGVQICLNEPVDHDTSSELFIKENFGEGVQHIAFETRDIFQTIEILKRNKLNLLQIHDSYYQDLTKEGYDQSLLNRLRSGNVMIDTEGGGRLLHAYTSPIEDRFFFEVVQRDNHTGFGRHDVTARLRALRGDAEVEWVRPARAVPPVVESLGARIDGNTVLTGTVGDPVSHIHAPTAMGDWFAKRGINAVWVAFHVHPRDLESFLRTARILENLRGFTVTMPHKIAVVPLLDDLTERARRIGAVNLVRREGDGRLVGDNADGMGCVKALEASGRSVAGASIWLVGAGGAGRAIAWALADARAERLSLSDIDLDRVAKLAAELGKAFPGLAIQIGVPDPKAVDIAINATPLGSSPDDPLPFDPQRLRSGTTVADVVMVPPQTALLDSAEDCGLHVLCGTKMLEYQLDDYGEFIGLVA